MTEVGSGRRLRWAARAAVFYAGVGWFVGCASLIGLDEFEEAPPSGGVAGSPARPTNGGGRAGADGGSGLDDIGDDDCARACIKLDACELCLAPDDDCVSPAECASACREPGQGFGTCIVETDGCDQTELARCLAEDDCDRGCRKLEDCGLLCPPSGDLCLTVAECSSECREPGQEFGRCLVETEGCSAARLLLCFDEQCAQQDEPCTSNADCCSEAPTCAEFDDGSRRCTTSCARNDECSTGCCELVFEPFTGACGEPADCGGGSCRELGKTCDRNGDCCGFPDALCVLLMEGLPGMCLPSCASDFDCFGGCCQDVGEGLSACFSSDFCD